MGLLGPPEVAKLQADRDVSGLIRVLGHRKDADSRQAAARALGQIGDRSAVGPLVQALKDSDENVLIAAARALGPMGEARSVEALIAVLQAPGVSWFVHAAAAEALGQIGDARAVEPLIAALPIADAVKALGRIGDARAVEHLIAALPDAADKARRNVGGFRLGDPVVVAQERLTDSLPIQALAKIGAPSVEPLIVALRDAKQEIRWGAAGALGEIGDPRAVEPLVAALQDEDSWVSQAAADALEKIGPPEGEPLIPAGQASGNDAAVSRPAGGGHRTVRVFVSSTFRDMQEEREELVKRVFPQLRKLCESRGVTWGEVDLRWGVPNEKKAEVLPICLAEIEHSRDSRPNFIGLLGERYGWVPKEIDPELIKRESWLGDHRSKSVTELEILHGVLNDPQMQDQALFYLRDPDYNEAAPIPEYRDHATAEEIADYGPEEAERRAAERRAKLEVIKKRIRPNGQPLRDESPSPEVIRELLREDQYYELGTLEEVEDLGPEEAERRAAERRAKLQTLKDRIRASGLPVRSDYPNPRALGEIVLRDMTEIIDRLFPAESEPSPLAREAADQEAFARSRSGVYVGRGEYTECLDAHAGGEGQPLVVLGESGSGKSALLSNWALDYRGSHPDESVLIHFVGASAASSDWAAMLRRIIGEFNGRFDLNLEIPDDPDALRLAFASSLHMAAAKGRVVLVLDALDQLEDRDGAPDLIWLPPQIPANVRLLLSTLPGRALEELKRRGWPSLEIEPLEFAERKLLIVKYLAQYSKALDPERVELLAGARQTSNPLFLRALLDEIRLWGDHDTLGPEIDRYLKAPSIDSLYELILRRYDADYERDRPGLTRDAFSLLWAARRGLSETELLDLLGADGQPLPRAFWSPLFLAIESSLTSRSGLLGFFHDYLRQAVEHRYLPTQQARTAAHLRLADYFAPREISLRKVDELPRQLSQAAAWPRLADLLSKLPFLQAAWRINPSEIKGFWTILEANSEARMADAYRPVLDAPLSQPADQLFIVANLFRETGHPDPALALQEHLTGRYREAGDRPNLQRSLGNQALILVASGDIDGALGLLKEQEQICRESGDTAGLMRALGNRAVMLRNRGDLEDAAVLLKHTESISRDLGDRAALAASLGNQAVILRARGDLDGALALLREQEQISRQLGDPAGLQVSLGIQAMILQSHGDLDGALALFREKERICRQLGDPAGVQASLGLQAPILRVRGDLDGAMALLKEQEQICLQLGQPADLQSSLGNQALILMDRGHLDDSLALLREQEQICRQLGDLASLQASLGVQGLALAAHGDLDGAMALHQEQERICRQLGQPADLQVSLGNQAIILRARGDLGGALALFKEQERICRQLGDPAGLQTSLGNQAVILIGRGDGGGALALLKEQEQICRQLSNPAGLQACLGNQAILLMDRGLLDGSMALLKEQERICRQLGNPAGLQTSLGNQAVVLKARGDLDGAMALHEEEERICRQVGDPAGLQTSLGNQAAILIGRGDMGGALALLKEQEQICRQLGDPSGLVASLGNQAQILGRLRRKREGLPLAEEAYRLAIGHDLTSVAQQIQRIIKSLR